MKLHLLNWVFFWFLAVIVFLMTGVLIANQLAGTKYQFFGPGSRQWASDKIRSGLESCPSNHVRILWFDRYPHDRLSFTEEEIREYDFFNRTIRYAGIEQSPSWWPGIDPSSIVSANHCGISQLLPERVFEIEKCVAFLPGSNSTEPLEESLSIAVNLQGKLRIYHYQFDAQQSMKILPSEVVKLAGYE